MCLFAIIIFLNLVVSLLILKQNLCVLGLNIIQLSTSYILFAGNYDDFRNIAKKITPDLPDKIARVKIDSNENQRNPRHYKIPKKNAKDDEINYYKKSISSRDNINLDRFSIDIDEIIERVKEKLKEDFKLCGLFQNRDCFNPKTSSETKHVDYNNYPKVTTKNLFQDNYKRKNEVNKKYGEIYTENTNNEPEINQETENDDKYQEFENNDGIYKTVDFIKGNDSYEDYVIPEKDHSYMSVENTNQRLKIGKEKSKKVSKIAYVTEPSELLMTQNDYDQDNEDFKAITKSLWYSDEETTDTTINKKTTKANVLKKSTKSHLKTIRPKRDFQKMSSPNYYAKLPKVAESYNFDEPIPVQDQEAEDLKPIGNPPAKINKKVNLL